MQTPLEALQKPRLRRSEASDYLLQTHGLRVAAQTLARYAVEGGGPRFNKASRAVLYPVSELDAWAAERLGDVVSNTGEAAAQARRTQERSAGS